jgi:hypothetical protein
VGSIFAGNKFAVDTFEYRIHLPNRDMVKERVNCTSCNRVWACRMRSRARFARVSFTVITVMKQYPNACWRFLYNIFVFFFSMLFFRMGVATISVDGAFYVRYTNDPKEKAKLLSIGFSKCNCLLRTHIFGFADPPCTNVAVRSCFWSSLALA